MLFMLPKGQWSSGPQILNAQAAQTQALTEARLKAWNEDEWGYWLAMFQAGCRYKNSQPELVG